MYILFFFSVHLLSPNPYLSRDRGGGPKHTPFSVSGRFPGSTQLWGSLLASLLSRIFPSF